MSKEKTLLQQVREALPGLADSIGKNAKGNIIVRCGYFYSGGSTSEKFSTSVMNTLNASGVKVTLVDHGDIWKPFRGGATIAQGSHWWAELAAEGGK